MRNATNSGQEQKNAITVQMEIKYPNLCISYEEIKRCSSESLTPNIVPRIPVILKQQKSLDSLTFLEISGKGNEHKFGPERL